MKDTAMRAPLWSMKKNVLRSCIRPIRIGSGMMSNKSWINLITIRWIR